MRLASVTVMVFVLVVLLLPSASAIRPVIYSGWTDTPPTIDGVFTPGEWSGPQIVFDEASPPSANPESIVYVIPTFVYFVNDALNLYVMVDAVGDKIAGDSDECLLWLGYGEGYGNFQIRIHAYEGEITNPFHAVVGFGTSPNPGGDVLHRIYEFTIPLSYISAAPGEEVDFCSPYYGKTGSMPYDADAAGPPYHDNVWPFGLPITAPLALDLWGKIVLGLPPPTTPVGGVVESVNKLAVFAPYLALFGVVAAAAVVVYRKRDD